MTYTAYSRPVHHITHPELSGAGKGEAAPVLAGSGVGGAVHQAVLFEQPVHGGGCQVLLVVKDAFLTQ